MYRYMGLILVIVFTNSCGSKVPLNPEQVKKSSGKGYCIRNGGDWVWNGKLNKWECHGFDMSAFNAIKQKFIDEKKQEKELKEAAEQERERRRQEELQRCLKNNPEPFISSDKLNVVIDQCRKLMWQKRVRREWGRWVGHGCTDPLYGFKNWRIPTRQELMSIGEKNHKATIHKIWHLNYNLLDLFSTDDRSIFNYDPNRDVNILCVRNATQKDIDAVLKYKEKVVGSTNFKNAKFINGVIWEDQPINSKDADFINNKRVEVDDFDECKSYCESLDLLGVKKWHVPTLMDYSQIVYGGYEKFDYSPSTKRGIGLGAMFIRYPYYFAVNKNSCKSKDDSDDCAYRVDFSPISSTHFDTADLHYYCRCALDVRDYNNAKQKAARQLDQSADTEDFDFYIKKFYLTNDVKLLKKAESLAHTRKQKAKLERAYIEYVGNYWKVFKLYSKDLTTKKINTTNDKFFYVAGISDYRKSKYKITLQRNPKAPFRLKYGKYKIPVEFTLNLTYNDISGIGSLKIGKFRNEKIKREVVFNLNPANGYKDTKVVDFGSVEYSQSGEVTPFIDVNSKIVDAKLESKIVSVE